MSATVAGQEALQTALAYYEAWTGGAFDHAMTYVADDIVCESPGGRLEGCAAFRAFMEPFTRIVTRTQLLAAFGDDRTALLVYDTETVPVKRAPGAERHIVENGKIGYLTIIFDRQPFTEARATAVLG